MNALKLYHDLKGRGVELEADGENLKVDAPAGVLTDEDRALLLEAKPALLLLCRHNAPEETSDDGRRFDARAEPPPRLHGPLRPYRRPLARLPDPGLLPVHRCAHEQAQEGRRGVIVEVSRRPCYRMLPGTGYRWPPNAPLFGPGLTNDTNDTNTSERTRA